MSSANLHALYTNVLMQKKTSQPIFKGRRFIATLIICSQLIIKTNHQLSRTSGYKTKHIVLAIIMETIINTISGFFQRDLCASDDCIVVGERESNFVAPLVDVAIGEFTL